MTVDELIRKYPVVKIEDGYADPPIVRQKSKDEGAWVRARRTPKNGIWYMVNDEINNQLIYPGNIIVVDKDLEFTQKLVEIPFKLEERKKLRLDAKYSNEMSNTSALTGFTRADVNAYVNACLTNYKKGNHDLASNSRWEYEQSDRQEGITLGGTIKGVNISGALGSRNRTVTVAYMKQIMYTVSLNNEYSEVSDIFTEHLDVRKFDTNLQKSTPYGLTSQKTRVYRGAPAIIDAVRYGRIISLWVVQESNKPASLSIDNLFNLSVGNTNSSTKYYLRVYGGIAGDQKFCIDANDKTTIENALKEMKEVSARAMETAMPVEYSVKFLRNLTTNVEWKVLPYYRAYIPQIKFRVTENNMGASMRVYVNALKYQMWGDKMSYVKWESPKAGLDYVFYISPKSLCFDIKVDVTGAADKYDFNIMLPLIPYDTLEGPNSDGEWEFQVNVYGRTIYDTKKFWCSPNVPGAVLSTTNQFWMNKYDDSPINGFDKTPAKHPETGVLMEKYILQSYIGWMSSYIDVNPGKISWASKVNGVEDLRPLYDPKNEKSID